MPPPDSPEPETKTETARPKPASLASSAISSVPPRVAVLVPCYNEALTVEKVVRDFRAALPDATVFVFDNNSSDDTARIAREAGAVVVFEKKRGKGHVVAAMLEKIDADVYIMVDGDDTYPAELAPKLIAPIVEERADVTVGLRVAADEAKAYRRFHVFGNWLVKSLINVIFGAKLKDIMSGYRAFPRHVARDMPVIAYGFDVETEMTLQCLYRRWVIEEIPITYRERPPGSVSKLNTISDGFKVVFRILNVFRSYKPLTFFGLIGILLMLAACGLGITAATLTPGAAGHVSLIVVAAGLAAMSLVSAAIGIMVQHVNFRFLELNSILRRPR